MDKIIEAIKACSIIIQDNLSHSGINKLHGENETSNSSGDIQKKLTYNDFVFGMPHSKWYGCFGVQTFINHNFLNILEHKYNITNMMNSVFCRADRCCLERILGCIFFTENPKINGRKSLFGNIMKYHKWGYTYEEYENDLKKNRIPRFIIKVWTGR